MTGNDIRWLQRFGLPEAAIQAIQHVLAAHPDVEQAIVYGSRAHGRQRPASDIDLTLIGPSISFGTLARIERVGQVLDRRGGAAERAEHAARARSSP